MSKKAEIDEAHEAARLALLQAIGTIATRAAEITGGGSADPVKTYAEAAESLAVAYGKVTRPDVST